MGTVTALERIRAAPRPVQIASVVALALIAPITSMEEESLVAHGLNIAKNIGSPGFPESDEELKSKVLDSVGRSLHPEGYSRHLAAIMASGSRVKLLKTITVPTLVIHGRDDLLVPLACGIDTARHIPDARLEIIDGMGHNLPEALMPRLLELIAVHIGQDGAPSAATG